MDPKLKLKPVEIIDIGIDKHTKIPIPILNENIIPTYTVDNGVPSDTFIINFNSYYSSQVFVSTIVSDYEINLTFDFGDGTNLETWLIKTGGTIITHLFPSAYTYTITASGWLDRIKTLVVSSSGTTEGGVFHVNITNLKKLSYLDLSNNLLTTISLNGLAYLNNILLYNNYFSNDVIDDIYIEVDTFLTFNGSVSTIGVNNGHPSIYSTDARTSLTLYKGWTLNYNI